MDNSGKSYYGETNLYLVGLNGQFECKVALGESEFQVDAVCILVSSRLTGVRPVMRWMFGIADKEGPIHDYAWNPNSREFSVCYGCESPRSACDIIVSNLTKFVVFDARHRHARPDGPL